MSLICRVEPSPLTSLRLGITPLEISLGIRPSSCTPEELFDAPRGTFWQPCLLQGHLYILLFLRNVDLVFPRQPAQGKKHEVP